MATALMKSLQEAFGPWDDVLEGIWAFVRASAAFLFVAFLLIALGTASDEPTPLRVLTIVLWTTVPVVVLGLFAVLIAYNNKIETGDKLLYAYEWLARRLKGRPLASVGVFWAICLVVGIEGALSFSAVTSAGIWLIPIQIPAIVVAMTAIYALAYYVKHFAGWRRSDLNLIAGPSLLLMFYMWAKSLVIWVVLLRLG